VVKIKVIDKLSGKTYEALVDTEKICVGSQVSYWLGMATRCFPMTPERFSTLMRHVLPGFGSVYIEALIMPDTIRVYVKDLIVISPGGTDIFELYYDLRLGEYGITYGGNFMPVRFNWEMAKCGSHACLLYGTLVREDGYLRHVPIIYEKEYLEWLRAMLARKPAESWEVIMSRLQIYEVTLNKLLEELSKLADRNAYELAVMVIQQARQLIAQVSQLQPQQRQT